MSGEGALPRPEPVAHVWTVAKLLRAASDYLAARAVERPRLDAEVLLARVLGRSRLDLYVDHDMPVRDADRSQLRALVRRRAGGEPVAYLVGEREFYSLPFKVDRRCLIPRPETEHLVDEALTWLRARDGGGGAPARVIDVGTGSGCIAISLARHYPQAVYHAIDRSWGALEVARENREALAPGAALHLHRGDLLAAVGDGPLFDLVLSNPPYVTDSEMAELASGIREQEPEQALRCGEDPVAFHRRLLEQAVSRVRPGGAVLLELPEGGFGLLEPWARARFEGGRFRAVADYRGTPRVFVATGIDA